MLEMCLPISLGIGSAPNDSTKLTSNMYNEHVHAPLKQMHCQIIAPFHVHSTGHGVDSCNTCCMEVDWVRITFTPIIWTGLAACVNGAEEGWLHQFFKACMVR